MPGMDGALPERDTHTHTHTHTHTVTRQGEEGLKSGARKHEVGMSLVLCEFSFVYNVFECVCARACACRKGKAGMAKETRDRGASVCVCKGEERYGKEEER